MLKCILYVIFICCIVSSLCVIIWKLCKEIKETDIIEERFKMNLYDLSGVPPMETLEIILNANENNLIPFESKVKICDDEDKVLSYGIQPKYAGCIAHITDIVIDEEHDENDKDDITRNRIYYLLDIDDSLYSCEILQRID